MKPLSHCTLYTFIDSAYLHGRNVTEIARQLCQGGSDLIQLRAKDWPPERIKFAAQSILPILCDHNVGLVINDHLQIALELGAHLCHLGQEDFFDSGHTHISSLNPNLNLNPALNPHSPNSHFSIPGIGLSTHAPAQAQRALAAGAHYIAIGPVFPTGTKPVAQPVTLDYVRWAAANVSIPWFAIGGINLANLPDILSAGATRICVVSAILNSPDIPGACHQFKTLLT